MMPITGTNPSTEPLYKFFFASLVIECRISERLTGNSLYGPQRPQRPKSSKAYTMKTRKTLRGCHWMVSLYRFFFVQVSLDRFWWDNSNGRCCDWIVVSPPPRKLHSYPNRHRRPSCVVYHKSEADLYIATLADQYCGREGTSISINAMQCIVLRCLE